MKAIVQTAAGDPDVLKLQDVAVPELRAGDVLIRVSACGVCYHDLVVREGVYRRHVHLPLIPGHEVSGIVEQVGPAVSGLAVGDRVCTTQRRSICGACRNCRSGREASCPEMEFMGDAHLNGGYAEFVAVGADNVVLVPVGVDLDAAAIVACAIGTELNAIRDVARIRVGEDVLITGAGGGLGIHGVQLARASGARVVAATSTEEKATLIRDAGAHEVAVIARGQSFTDFVKQATDGHGVDAVIDNVGTPVFDSVLHSLASGGRWVLLGQLTGDFVPFNPAQMFLNNISLISAMSCSRAQLSDALQLVRRGVIQPMVAEKRDLKDAADVHREMKAGRLKGRVVLKP